MPTLKERLIRILPGRLRLEVRGLKNNHHFATFLVNEFREHPGIHTVSPSIYTGRVLFSYDLSLDPQKLIERVLNMEQSFRANLCQPLEEIAVAQQNMAVQNSNLAPNSHNPIFSLPFPWTGETTHPDVKSPQAKLPLPLALSIGGLGVLGIKQLVTGKSALARSPAAFHLAAAVSAVSGYPLLKRNFEKLFNYQIHISDYILGASALGLALIRENLVVLAGLGILQYLKWQKSQSAIRKVNQPLRNQAIQNYAERASKVNLLLAGTTWALTGEPLIGLGVLLAGNPRVATLPAEYAWNQAELAAPQKGYVIPEQCSLEQLSNIHTVIFEDTLLLTREHHSEVACISEEENRPHVWHYAASMMKKTNHPWLEEVRNKAKTFKGTIRAAFKVESSEQGAKAAINGSEVLMGSLKYLQQQGVNCDHHLIEVKRAQRQGFDVVCLAENHEFLGFLTKSEKEIRPIIGETLNALKQTHLEIGALRNSANLNEVALQHYRIHPPASGLAEPEIIEQLAAQAQTGKNILFVTDNDSPLKNLLHNSLPVISIGEIQGLMPTILYSHQIAQNVDKHFRIAKRWNLVGSILAATSVFSAPVINLLADGISLVLLSRSKRLSETFNPAQAHPVEQNIHTPSTTLGPVGQNVHTPSTTPGPLGRNVHTPSTTPGPLGQNVHPPSTTPGPLGRNSGIAWHALSVGEILGKLNVNPESGLTSNQVTLQREHYGSNQLEQRQPVPWILSYLNQFKEFTTLIVLGTSVLALLSGDIFDGLAMGGILLANAAIGTMQERKAEKVIEALNQFQPPHCKVIRDGQTLEISGQELVPGDVVTFAAGDRVPADLRLLQSWNLEVNESALTGESLPVPKSNEQLGLQIPLAERKNMLFLGTDITRGKGIGVVINTGMETEMGYLMSLMKGQEKVLTPLHEKVTSISKAFIKAAFIAGGLVFVVGLLRGRPLTQMITTSITLAASAVPEGLPVTITIALSAGIFRMAKKNALIRKLSALETLGRTTVICTDKTGTLTKNEMTVKRIATVQHRWKVAGEGYEPSGEVIPLDPYADAAATSETAGNSDLIELAKIGLLCNNTKLLQEEAKWTIHGDPTEGALLSLAGKLGLWQERMEHWHRVHEVPFDSNSGTMSVVCRDTQTGQDCYIFCKGAVETVLSHCTKYVQNGEVLPLTEATKEAILRTNDEFAHDALRVLGFAYCPTEWVDDEPGVIGDELIYVGLMGMIDPPKPEVEKSIREALELGVKPVMITGDHPITAIAIAKELGIAHGEAKVLTGQELDRLSDKELADVVEDVSIFARVTPEHKLRIVTAYQKRGHIVAMTGDGVNDTPAIKQSNVGIAMGQTGTDVTKATADMILKQDHFGSIIEGVKEGRTIIGNIRKAIGCLLTGNLAEIIVTATAVIIGLPIPLVPIQILLMNLLTDAIPAMILAINPGQKGKQTERLDIVDKAMYQKVISRGILLGAASLGLFAVTLGSGASLAVAQTVAFTTLVMGQFVQTLSWRQEGSQEGPLQSLKDRYLIGGLGLSVLAFLAALYVPPIARFFHTAPLTLQHWLYILLAAGSVSLLSRPFLAFVANKDKMASQKQLPLSQPKVIAA